MVKGLVISSSKKQETCVGCIRGKLNLPLNLKSRKTSTTRLLELFQSEFLGPLEAASVDGSQYIIIFHTHQLIIQLDRRVQHVQKVRVSKMVQDLQSIRRYSHSHEFRGLIFDPGEIGKLKPLFSDNGCEYLPNDFKNYLR